MTIGARLLARAYQQLIGLEPVQITITRATRTAAGGAFAEAVTAHSPITALIAPPGGQGVYLGS